jgi:hypothetical protein
MRARRLPFPHSRPYIAAAMSNAFHYRPYSSSCPRCQCALDLAAVEARGTWYCSSACAEGRSEELAPRRVAESWLTHRPRRFHRRRMPKELRSAQSRNSS